MKNLFLIDGASGSGKTDLVKYVQEFSINAKIVPKYTTRDRRPYEDNPDFPLDLIWISNSEFDKLSLDYQYKYGGKRYGFNRSALIDALRDSQNVFIIVRNDKIIRQLMMEYSFINVVPVYIYTEREKIISRLAIAGLSKEQIKTRIERLSRAYDDYLKHPHLYMEILINNSEYSDYARLIEGMIDKYSTMPSVSEHLVFVLMSFSREDKSLTDYYNAIKRSVKNVSPILECMKLNELPGSYMVTGTAKSKIQECRLAIVDLTENKPNVFYELGFAHGIGKECILTMRNGTPMQLYPKDYNIITYDSATELEEQLTMHLRKILKLE